MKIAHSVHVCIDCASMTIPVCVAALCAVAWTCAARLSGRCHGSDRPLHPHLFTSRPGRSRNSRHPLCRPSATAEPPRTRTASAPPLLSVAAGNLSMRPPWRRGCGRRGCTPQKQSGRASCCLQEPPLPYVPVFCESGRRNREVRRVWRADPLDNSTWNQHNPLDVIQRCPPP